METLSMNDGNRKRWRMNGITYFYKAGKLCQCCSKRPRVRKGRKKDGTRFIQTPEQEKSKERFTMMAYFKRFYFVQIKGFPVWDVAPGLPGQTRLSKFHSANSGACDERGVMDYPGFRFSEGVLLVPMNTRVRREGWVLSVAWENREERGSSRASDRLMVGYFYDSRPDAPRLLAGVGGRRGDCRAVFTVPDAGMALDEVLHVYLFFGREDGTAFSRSVYARAEVFTGCTGANPGNES